MALHLKLGHMQSVCSAFLVFSLVQGFCLDPLFVLPSFFLPAVYVDMIHIELL